MRWRGATCTGLASPGCAAPSGFLSRLTLSSPHHPAGLVSYRRHSWGSPFRGFPFRSPGRLSAPLAPPGVPCRPTLARRRLRPRAVVRRSEPEPLSASPHVVRDPLLLIAQEERSQRRARGRSRYSGAPSGVSARIGSPYSGRRVLPRTMGADPLLGFQPSRGFPLLALTRPSATRCEQREGLATTSPLVRFVAACRNRPLTDASGSRSAGRLAGLAPDCRPSWGSCPRPG
jgi:hypothetical protein